MKFEDLTHQCPAKYPKHPRMKTATFQLDDEVSKFSYMKNGWKSQFPSIEKLVGFRVPCISSPKIPAINTFQTLSCINSLLDLPPLDRPSVQGAGFGGGTKL